MAPSPLLEAQDLAAVRGDASLFAGVRFHVEAGHVLVVRGPNGSGKTTLLRILAGLSSAVEGAVRWCGERMRPLDPRLRKDVAFMGHAAALKDELTAQENLDTLARLAGDEPSRETLASALAMAGLAAQHDLPARVLSQGQRRRIALARLTLGKRPLWILDEPATALDDAALAWLAQLIRAHAAGGGVAVIATHQSLALAHTPVATLELG